MINDAFKVAMALAVVASLQAPKQSVLAATHVADGAPIRLKATTFNPVQGETPDIPPGLAIAGYPTGQRGYYVVLRLEVQ